jgi:hypothetical protein
VQDYVEERDLVGRSGSNIPVRVLADTGTTAKVITKGAGVHVSGDQTYNVPTAAINNGR